MHSYISNIARIMLSSVALYIVRSPYDCLDRAPSLKAQLFFLFQRVVLETFSTISVPIAAIVEFRLEQQSWLWFVLLIPDSISDDINPHSPHNTKIHTITLIQAFPGFLALLAPTGALVVMMVYYTYIYQPTFSDFHSVHWCNWCYKCHSK